MSFSYNPLWKTLIDNNMNKTKLKEALDISSATIAKMSKNEYVAMRVLDDICQLLNCNIQDVVEFIPTQKESE